MKDFFIKTRYTSKSWQRTLFIMLFAQFVSAIGFSIIFPFLPVYVQVLGARTSLSLEFWAGMAFSAPSLTMMVASPIWGAIADRFGRKLMVVRAMFGGAMLLVLMGFVSSAEELVFLRAVQGLVSGTIPAVNALVAAAVPRERSGYAMGMLQMGLWSGLAVGPLVGGIIADTWGFQAAFIVTGGLLVTAGLLVWLGIEEFFLPIATVKHSFAFVAKWRGVLSLPGVGPTYGARSLSWLGQTMMVPILPLFIQSLLPESTRVNTFTGLVVGLAAATGMVSAVYLGRLGDKVGHRRLLFYSGVVTAGLYMLQTFIAEVWHLLFLQALTGAASGGIIPMLSAMLVGYTQPGQEGTVYGLDSSLTGMARAIAPLIGATVAVWFGFRGTFVVTGLLFLLTAVLIARWLPERKQGVRPESQSAFLK